MPVTLTGQYSNYHSQAARDAAKSNVRYADYIERTALEHCAYYVVRGDLENARRMLTQSLAESLVGNDGD